MIYVLMAIVLAISGSCLKESSRAHLRSQSLRVIVNPFNPAGIPVRINAATAENSVVSCWIEYSVTNLSGEDIDAIYLRVFIADSEGRLIRVRDSFSKEEIAAGATQNDRAQIKGNIKQQTVAFVAVTKVITKSGVWQVSGPELEAAIKAKLSNQTDLNPSVSFESNAISPDVGAGFLAFSIEQGGVKYSRGAGISNIVQDGSGRTGKTNFSSDTKFAFAEVKAGNSTTGLYQGSIQIATYAKFLQTAKLPGVAILIVDKGAWDKLGAKGRATIIQPSQ